MSQKIMDIDSRLLDPEEIDKCLNCKRPECNDCLGRQGWYENSLKSQWIVLEADKLVEWYNEGRSYRWISEKLGTNLDTIRKRMKEYGIGFSMPRPTLTYAFFLALPEEQRRHLTWKGERMG